MEQETPSHAGSSSARTGLIGTLVAGWWLLDGLVAGIPVVVLAAVLNPLLVFVVAAPALVLINGACVRWIDGNWDGWMAENGQKLEKKLEKWRTSRVMKHPVGWITRGSDVWFGLAAALLNAIVVVGIARLIGGKPIGARRNLVAAASYGIFAAALWSLIGFAAGDAIHAL